MQTVKVDVAIVGGGGAGLRAAIAAAERYPDASIALISKVYPMRSHTVAAEGGSAGVVGEGDSLETHFNDTVAGGDWLSDQDVVEYFVNHATEEMYQLEKWGIPWSRRTDGRPNVRRFGGMSQPRTWFAADKTGFYMLHSMFQTSLKYPQIVRYDEFFGLEVVTAGEGDNRRVHGVLAYTMRDGYPVLFEAPSVVITTGGAGRIYGSNTNGAICTADGMGMAYRAGVPLRDMEFVQYHPTALPGSGVLLTEGARGEGGILVNRDGYRYLQDYGLGPETPLGKPENKFMELGPRDRVSQAYWHELQKGRTIDTAHGPAVGLDLRHLGKDYIHERLPLIVELAEQYLGLDPVVDVIPVRPSVHYTMGGIRVDISSAASVPGLFAAGECSSSGLHGANRLGSNSLAELCVLGKVAGEQAAAFAMLEPIGPSAAVRSEASAIADRYVAMMGEGSEDPAAIRREMNETMDAGLGIYRTGEGMAATVAKIAELQERYRDVKVTDTCPVYNTDWTQAIELGFMLEVAHAMAASALAREESRGAHQRLDGFSERDDEHFLMHTLATRDDAGGPVISYEDVVITKSMPAVRAYGAAGQAAAGKAAAAASGQAAAAGKAAAPAPSAPAPSTETTDTKEA